MLGTIWIVLEDGRIMTLHKAEPDFYTEGCDASIDYTLFDKFFKEIDGGQIVGRRIEGDANSRLFFRPLSH